MRLFDPLLYENVHLLIVAFITVLCCILIQNKRAERLLHKSSSFSLVYFYAVVFIIVVGFRPIVAYTFGDSIVYANAYNNLSHIEEGVSSSRDLLFTLFMWSCSRVMSVNYFFFIVELLYVGSMVIACNRLFAKSADIALLFCFGAFSFFTYGVNGIRNGLALSLVLVAISLLQGNWREKVICILLSIIAISFHASASLPVLCMFAAIIIKKPKFLFWFWGLSIIVSLAAGNSISNLFASIGFDDRLSDYIHPDIEEDIYTKTGFRWDFLLYSFMPILLGWYVIFKKKVINSTYQLLLGTYIFANAFWIMVIRAEFSNRFAYLSWFLYPIVLAYPLLKFKLWPKTQGQKTAMIMFAHLAFTLIMVFIVG